MYLQVLKNIMISRGFGQADIARMAGVSRAAVCKWFKTKDGICNVETHTLINLARGLKVSPEIFLRQHDDISPLATWFLWDQLYPTMEEFAVALVRKQLPALARLVQVTDFHTVAKIAGPSAISLFPRYKKFIKPARRAQLENLWPLYLN